MVQETSISGQMSINYNVSHSGHHIASWRLSDSRIEQVTSLEHYVALAAEAERGKLDAVFMADHLAQRENPQLALSNTPFEPITLMTALAARTSRIGVVATVSTSYSDPFTIARQIGTLQLLSEGRAAVNLVTSTIDAAARNYGRDAHFDHAERYERAQEYAEVLYALWDSWDLDAIKLDRETGVLVDTSKIKPILHKGRYFRVDGPLNIPPSSYGPPVVFQAGGSDRGVALAGYTADAVYARSYSLEESVELRRRLQQSAVTAGRPANAVKVLPGFVPYVAETTAEARDILAEVNGLTVGAEESILQMSEMLQLDLRDFDPDGPLPLHLLPPVEDVKKAVSSFIELRTLAKTENLSIRQLAARIRGAAPLGMTLLVGSGEEIADKLEHWFRSGAADGFNIMIPIAPKGLTSFIDEVIPVLQERKLFREEYEGSSLRQRLGLQ